MIQAILYPDRAMQILDAYLSAPHDGVIVRRLLTGERVECCDELLVYIGFETPTTAFKVVYWINKLQAYLPDLAARINRAIGEEPNWEYVWRVL